MKFNLAYVFQELRSRALPFKNVLGFTFGHWRRQKPFLAATGVCILLSTMADVLVPVYAGRLIDAIAPNGGAAFDRAAALDVALHALIVMIGLGAIGVLFRHLGFYAIV
ncbi:MAG: hypothetical protein ABUL54_09550, partial [Dongia sp.]